MSGASPYNDKDGRHSIALVKEKKASNQHRSQEAVLLTPHDVVPQKPSARNTPMISFQPHHTEISTDWPSVSGRLYIHIPKIPGKKFHFVSLTLQLRLKEAMAWTRQDLVSFEIEKQNWSQTVWERKINLPYQDRQVEEGDEPYVAVVKEPSSKTHQGRIEIAADEWRWEWLMPVTEKEVRPESFEGSMGNVWYELEAKCLFRWDDVDKDGNVLPSTHRTYETSAESLAGHGSERGPAATLLKAVEVSSAKSKSLAQVFGKLRVGGKSKKIQTTGDFSPADQHDQYIKESLRARKNSMPQGGSGVNGDHAGTGGALRERLLSASSRAHSTPHLNSLGSDSHAHAAPEYPPFLIRKVLKLYFIKPPPNTSSSPAFFLPPPSMALPTLPGTRRLKAIIPGARIQVQIQIPSLIPIRGYAQTSQLVPDKKGGLVLSKHAPQNQLYNHNNSRHALEIDSGYLDSFQAALTVRKVTQKEINNSDHLKKRYHSATSGINSASVFATAGDSHSNNNGDTGSVRKRLDSSNVSSADLHGQYAAGGRIDDGAGALAGTTVPAERPWRKEILVRKVKCEFWQKESCRFPSSSSDSPSRSIKYAMGPAFTYSEKEQVRERQRERSHSLTQLANSRPHSAPRSPTQQTSAVSWDTSVTRGSSNPGIGEDPRKAVRKNSSSAIPISPILKTSSLSSQSNLSAPSSPLQVPTMPQPIERKGSNASQYSSMASSQPRTSFSSSHASRPHLIQGHHSSQSSNPFMLLIPVPLDSPKLRQTFTWPSVETPAPTTNKGYEPVPMPMPQSIPDVSPAMHNMSMANTEANVVAGADNPLGVSNSPRSSESGLIGDDVDTSGRRHQHQGHSRSHQHQSPAAKANATRSRIEVKHYLSFRLSIDMLEYEGELDQDDDLDLEALEEQQLQQIRNRQELSAYRPNAASNNSKVLSRSGTVLSTASASGAYSSTSPVTASSSSISPLPNSTNQGLEGSRQGTGALSRATMTNVATVASGASSMNSSHASSVPTTAATATATGGMMTVPSALTFLNSTAGLLDMESEADNSHQGGRHQGQGGDADIFAPPQPAFANYDTQQRRGSNASQGTVKSSCTTNSGHHHHPSHATSLVAGAFGALKKKVSTSALNSIVNIVTPATLAPVPALPQLLSANVNTSLSPQQHYTQHHHHQQQHSHRTAPTVHKLKDFVIRVPITVVIQVEDFTRVGTARIDGTDSATQTTGASATVAETLDGSQGSEVETNLTADLRSEDGDRSVSSGSNTSHNDLGKSPSSVVKGQEPPYLALQEHQRLVEGKGGKARKMSIGNSMEIRSIHGEIEGEDEDGDAEYVEGQFIADQEQD
ncbi:hypothetical protein EC957_011264 [Mortierella hygrophila]|uniref:Uncharacterized protein n=1 Tax=Mortierella hygrophila TaxID=979708 RepID=A0A9P6F8U6_9FUNG|nr:hypothetical protein EC957_011264 [Mortierella hygrophila]